LVRQTEGGLAPRLIGQAARDGDAAAQTVWVELGRRLGIGLANIVNILNPDRIVIGGGVAHNFSLFAPTLMKTLKAEAMVVPASAVRVVRAALGDQAGIVGGAVLVWSAKDSNW
jgi:glucokinase